MCQICNYNENIATLPCDRCSKRLGPNGWHHASGGFRFHDDCKSASGEAAPQEGDAADLIEEIRSLEEWAQMRGEWLNSNEKRIIRIIRTLSDGKAAAEARAKEVESEVEGLRWKAATAEANLEEQTGIKKNLKIIIGDLEHQRSEWRSENAKLNDKLNGVYERVADIAHAREVAESRCAALERHVGNLVMLIKRIAAARGSTTLVRLIDAAIDYVCREDLQGSILRDDARAALSSAEPAKLEMPQMPECVRELIDAVTYEAGDHYDCFNSACKFMRPFDALPEGRPHNPDCLIAAVESYYAKPFVPAGEEK